MCCVLGGFVATLVWFAIWVIAMFYLYYAVAGLFNVFGLLVAVVVVGLVL